MSGGGHVCTCGECGPAPFGDSCRFEAALAEAREGHLDALERLSTALRERDEAREEIERLRAERQAVLDAINLFPRAERGRVSREAAHTRRYADGGNVAEHGRGDG